jgi:hypothetical protein
MTYQMELLKKRLSGNRIILDPDERRHLMKLCTGTLIRVGRAPLACRSAFGVDSLLS